MAEEQTLLRNKFGCIFVETLNSAGPGDNLAIALASYFTRHLDRPENDPPDEETESWGKWVIQKTNEALDLIAGESKRICAGKTPSPAIGDHVTIEELELAHIKAIVAKTATLDDAARILGIDIATLYRKRRRHGMEMRG